MSWLKEDSYGIPVLLALGIHAGIILTGIIAIDFSDNETKKPKTPVIVNATIIDISNTVIGKRESKEKEAKRQAIVAAEKRKRELAQKTKKNNERKALEEKKKKQAQAKIKADKAKKEEAKRKKIAADKKENERKQADEKKRLAQELESKRLKQAAEKKRLEQKAADAKEAKEQELIRRLEADRLANEERKRQEEAQRLAEQKRQAEIAAAKAAAEVERQRASEEAQMVQSISSLINSRVTSAWIRPPSARNGMKTKLRINFLPNGEVLKVEVTEGSGDLLFDQKAVDAVNKVRRIEELADVDSYTFERNFRQVDLIFNPQDLRN